MHTLPMSLHNFLKVMYLVIQNCIDFLSLASKKGLMIVLRKIVFQIVKMSAKHKVRKDLHTYLPIYLL